MMVRLQREHFPERRFFVSIIKGPDLQTARRDGFAAILRQLTWLPPGSRRSLVGACRVERPTTDNLGQTHVLAALERDKVAAHLTRLRDRALALAAGTLARCEQSLDNCRLTEARSCLGQGRNHVKAARVLHVASRAAVGDESQATPMPGEGRLERLTTQFKQASVRCTSVLVRVVRTMGGKADGDLDAAFAEAVIRADLKVANGSLVPSDLVAALNGHAEAAAKASRRTAAYLVLGQVRSRFTGKEMGQYFATARGQVRVIETASARILVELNTGEVKGGHIARTKACRKATDNVVARLVPQLERRLRSELR